MSAISQASAGIVSALVRFERASAQVVSASSSGQGDVVQPIADIVESRAQFQANAGALRAADEMTRVLLDILV